MFCNHRSRPPPEPSGLAKLNLHVPEAPAPLTTTIPLPASVILTSMCLTYVESYSIGLFVSGFFHLAYRPECPLALWYYQNSLPL